MYVCMYPSICPSIMSYVDLPYPFIHGVQSASSNCLCRMRSDPRPAEQTKRIQRFHR